MREDREISHPRTEGRRAISDSPKATPGKGALLVVKALRRVLRPLVKLLLAHSIPFQQAAGVLKQVYVDVAVDELERSGSRLTTSRLTVSTGIHRKEIKRLRENPLGDREVPRSVSLGAQLVARWTNEAPFVDLRGKPIPLSRTRDVLGTANFDELVTSVSTDVHPRAVLEEFLRLGVVRVDDDKKIHLVTAGFVPRKGFEEKVFYFERNLHDHLDVAARNLAAEEPPLLERSVHYGDLSPAAVDELADLASREGMKLLQTVNRRARALRSRRKTRAKRQPGEPVRLNFGLYFYRDPEVEHPESSGDQGGEPDDD